jgi:hypothetical protein
MRPTLSPQQLTRLTEAANLAAKDIGAEILDTHIQAYLEQCEVPDIDLMQSPDEMEGYSCWIQARFFDLFAEYLRNYLKDQAKLKMADAVIWFENRQTPADEGTAAAGYDYHNYCSGIGCQCNCYICSRQRNLPDHDQRAEGLGDGY